MGEMDKKVVPHAVGMYAGYAEVKDVVKAVNSLLAGVGDNRIRLKTTKAGYELTLEEIDIG